MRTGLEKSTVLSKVAVERGCSKMKAKELVWKGVKRFTGIQLDRESAKFFVRPEDLGRLFLLMNSGGVRSVSPFSLRGLCRDG